MARRNKLPAKVKSYWCWGCKSFVVVNYDERKYFCKCKNKEIRPPEEMKCQRRNEEDFKKLELPEQFELDLE